MSRSREEMSQKITTLELRINDLTAQQTSLVNAMKVIVYHNMEINGTIGEYKDVPCKSLRQRVFEANSRAVMAITKELSEIKHLLEPTT